MKIWKIASLLLVAQLSISALPAHAQTGGTGSTGGTSGTGGTGGTGGTVGMSAAGDSLAIDRACKDYVEGYYTNDSNRIRRAMHPELCKRILAKKANYKIYSSTVDDLIRAANGKKPPDPDPSTPFAIRVDIYDITADIATAKISTNKLPFIDYAQLAKVNEEWKVVNVLWGFVQAPGR